MRVQDKLLTVDEFETRYIGQPYELIAGVVTEIMPTGIAHGGIVRRMAGLLGQFVDAHQLGEVVTGEVGFKLDDHTMRAPDVAFIPRAIMNSLKNPEKFGTVAPALAVEVLSPNDHPGESKAKVDKFLAAGTLVVWVVDPDEPKVSVYQAGQSPYSVPGDGILDGGTVLPGLQIAVADLFPTKEL